MRPLFISSVLLTLHLVACSSSSQDTSPIPIGGGFDLSQGESALDLPASHGAQIAASEINASGGVLGRPINLILRDTKYDQATTKQVAQQFVQNDKISALIGFSDTDSVLWAGPIIQAAGLPFITVGATSPELPSQVGSMMFLACFGDNVQAAAGAQFGIKKFGKTAYLLWDADIHYTTLLHQYFTETFTQLGGTIVGKMPFSDMPKDFNAQINAIKALPQQPAFYYFAAMPYNIGLLVKQMRAAGLMGPIIGGDGYDDSSWIAMVGNDSNNVYFSTHALVDPVNGTDRMKQFISSYTTRFGDKAAINAFSALGYDTLYLVTNAIKRANSTDPGTIKSALESTSGFEGITGSISFSATSHVPTKGVTIIALVNGKYTLGDEFVPQYIPAPPR